MNPNSEFGSLLKAARLKAGLLTLQALSEELAPHGIFIDPSLLSHWQRGARLPKDRQTIFLLIKVLVKNEGITSQAEANTFCEHAGMGFLTEKEVFELFPISQLKVVETNTAQPALNVYFTASIFQAPVYGEYYEMIIKTLKELGHLVTHEHITTKTFEEIKKYPYNQKNNYYLKMSQWISQCDVVVIEGSFPSTINIGHEMTVALYKKKPVILFYEEGKDTFLLPGLRSEHFYLLEYTRESLPQLVKQSISFVQDQIREK